MNFIKILKRVWHYIWRNKFIWLLGILAMWGGGGSLANFLPEDSQMVISQEVLAWKIINWLQEENGAHDLGLWLIFSVILGIFLILVLYSARVGLINTFYHLHQGKQPKGLWHSLKKGFNSSWRLLALNLILGLAGLMIIMIEIVWLLPYFFQASFWVKSWSLAIIVIGLVVFVYLSILIPISERTLILQHQGIFTSIFKAGKIISQNLKNFIKAWLINIVIILVFSFLFTLSMLLIFAISGFIIYNLTQGNQLFFSIVLIIIIPTISVLILMCGLLTSFLSGFWTLVYRAIIK